MSDILTDIPESHRDLLRRTLTASLSTIDAEGRPRSTAIWYFVDSDGQLRSCISSDLEKYKDLRRNPSCSLLIIDTQNPFHTLEVHAQAELTADPDSRSVRKLAHMYGLDAAKVPFRKDRYTVTFHPYRVVAGRFWAEEVLFGEVESE